MRKTITTAALLIATIPAIASTTFNVWRDADGVKVIDAGSISISPSFSSPIDGPYTDIYGVKDSLSAPAVGNLSAISNGSIFDSTVRTFTSSYHVQTTGDWLPLSSIRVSDVINMDPTANSWIYSSDKLRFSYGVYSYGYQVTDASGKVLQQDSHKGNYTGLTDTLNYAFTYTPTVSDFFIKTTIDWTGPGGMVLTPSTTDPNCGMFTCMDLHRDTLIPIAATSYMTATGPFVTVEAVPEPESYALALLGLVSVGVFRRRTA